MNRTHEFRTLGQMVGVPSAAPMIGFLQVQNMDEKHTKRFVFLLLENFTLLAFANAIEPLRIANRTSETPL